MEENKLSRRDFLRVGAVTAAGVTLAACGGTEAPAEPTKAPAAATDAPAPTSPPAAAEKVTLEVMSLAEYEAPYAEIWNVFNASSADSEVSVFSINEDTAAAHEAKVAGGYLPAIELTQEMQIFFDKNNYEMAVNLADLDFPWWDRWQFDVKNMWSDLHGLPGPRSLDVFQGYVVTWQYNDELMQQSGLDPHNDVKSWADLEKWLADGAAWAAKTDGVDWFYNQAWHNWVDGNLYTDLIPLAFPDGGAGPAGRLLDWQGQVQRRGLALPPLLRVLQKGQRRRLDAGQHVDPPVGGRHGGLLHRRQVGDDAPRAVGLGQGSGRRLRVCDRRPPGRSTRDAACRRTISLGAGRPAAKHRQPVVHPHRQRGHGPLGADPGCLELVLEPRSCSDEVSGRRPLATVRPGRAPRPAGPAVPEGPERIRHRGWQVGRWRHGSRA